MTTVRIVGHGHATPSRVVSNDEIERELGLESGWIERRTGVLSRRVCGPEESCSTLAIAAGGAALERAGLDAADVGLVLLATSTPDHPLPPTAPAVAHALGMGGAGAVDLAGACAGFLYALTLADGFVRTSGRPALVIAANVLSRRLRQGDAGGRAIFADGAGALALVPSETHQYSSILSSHLGSDGRHANAIRVVAGGSVRPIDMDAIEEGLHYLRIEDASRVFVEAVAGMERAGRAALQSAGLSSADIDLWVPHQANSRILDRAGRALGFDAGRTVLTLPTWGNSSAASLPTAISLAAEEGRIRKGKSLLLTAVGAGMVEAGAVIEW